jgi:hypothetical protein
MLNKTILITPEFLALYYTIDNLAQINIQDGFIKHQPL